MKQTSFKTIFRAFLVTVIMLLQTGAFLTAETEASPIELKLTVDVSPRNGGTVKVFGATRPWFPQIWNIFSQFKE